MTEHHCPGLGKEHVVVLLIELLTSHLAAAARGPDGPAVQDHHVLLIDGEPELHLGAVLLKKDPGVAFKGVDGGPLRPTATSVQRRGQVEVVHGHHGLDALGQERVDHPVIMGDARGVDLAVTVRDDPGPGDGEAVGIQPQLCEELHVLGVAVVMVRGDIEVRDTFRTVHVDVDH